MLIRKGIAEGMTFVASVPPDGSPISFPSSVDGVIAVRSAGSAAASPAIATHAVVAPGNEILTTLPQGGYNFVNGSSYATAHVSGLIALMLQADSKLDSHLVLGILQHSSSTPNVNVGRKESVVDACRAMSRLGSASMCAGAL
jgi:subtilisin family serine protease